LEPTPKLKATTTITTIATIAIATVTVLDFMAVLVGEEQIIEVESSTIIIAMAIIIDLVWVIMPILDYYCIAFDSSTYSNSCYQAWNFICSLLNFF